MSNEFCNDIVLLHKTCEDAGRMIHSNNNTGMHAVLYWRGSDDIIIIIIFLLMQIQTIIMDCMFSRAVASLGTCTYINWVQVLECTIYYCTGGY